MFRVSFFLLLFRDNWLQMPGIYNTQRDLYLKVNAVFIESYFDSQFYFQSVKDTPVMQKSRFPTISDLCNNQYCATESSRNILYYQHSKQRTQLATGQLYWCVNQCIVESWQNQTSHMNLNKNMNETIYKNCFLSKFFVV